MPVKFQPRIPEPRAVYSRTVYDGVIAIVDLNQGRTVTNDADNVIADLAGDFDLARYRVIYRDTRGVWDELRVRDARFDGFASINERDLETALAKVRGRP